MDITGKNQHGFKKGHSTITAMMDIQNNISTAIDNKKYVAMLSLDLSAAFDVVNHRRLFRILRKIGLPENLVLVIEEWFAGRSFYVDVNGSCSIFSKIICGTIQGSVLGPILFSIFVKPNFVSSMPVTSKQKLL